MVLRIEDQSGQAENVRSYKADDSPNFQLGLVRPLNRSGTEAENEAQSKQEEARACKD
jgi:hypothetical protein